MFHFGSFPLQISHVYLHYTNQPFVIIEYVHLQFLVCAVFISFGCIYFFLIFSHVLISKLLVKKLVLKNLVIITCSTIL